MNSSNTYTKFATSASRSASWAALLATRASLGVAVTTRDLSLRGAQRSRAWITRSAARARRLAARGTDRQVSKWSAIVKLMRMHGLGMLWVGVAVVLSVGIAIRAVDPLQAAGGIAICAFALWLHLMYTQQLARLRARVGVLETRVARAGRPEYVELVDVDLLDDRALVAARARCMKFAMEVESELDIRRAYEFESPSTRS